MAQRICSVKACGREHYAFGWCHRHYRRARDGRSLDLSYVYGQATEERFWAKVDQRGPDECWPWTGCVLTQGYGQFSIGERRRVKAHRYSYELFVGPIPPGKQLDHMCHNRDRACRGGPSCLHRRCVNPRHLLPATNRENTRRAFAR